MEDSEENSLVIVERKEAKRSKKTKYVPRASSSNFIEIEKRTDVYRRSTLGQTLFSALQELLDEKKLTPSLANEVMDQFDRSVSLVLHDLPCTFEAVFTAEGILSYNFIGDRWAVRLKNCLFSFVDQEVDDDIGMVQECVIHAVNPVPYSIDLQKLETLATVKEVY